jgi:GntR family transcriptional regulator / MocR family aminotransferase
MELHVVIDGERDLSGQLYRQLRDAIRGGRLPADERLPPSRLLAEQLGVSRKTVSEVYARLTFEKLLVGRIGIGTFVAHQAAQRPARRIAAPSPARNAAAPLAGSAVVERWRALATPLRHPPVAGMARYEFIGGAPSTTLFPHADWRRCTLHALREAARTRSLYGPAEGLPELRDQIARHVAFARGVRCTANEVIVTSGAQQAIDLVARVLVEPGATVVVEEPGYPQARLILAAHGARVVGAPVDAQGMVVDAIPADARLVYVTPAHQFPLGMPMSTVRRRALLARAQAIGAIVVEDDYDSEFRYEGRPTDSLQGMDDGGNVAFVGTFSKTVSPALRLGYVIAPPHVAEAIAAAKHLADWHTPTQSQSALARFMADGSLQKHLRRCHAAYAQRRERLLRRFADDLAPWFELVPATAGFHVAALCRGPLDIATLVNLARRVDVGLYPLAGFGHFEMPRAGLILGYGLIETGDIDPALDRVRDVLLQMG